ncbi:MATE family efflux transporter [Teredinibacter purpureus]|uniref:MATE family efflux transporter n=1 Tax=Teredinibacter purpureus TaxID=2731756 RepID=UPI0005F7E423|nr:MATE family efflux transporter [Teredinibacter purpureus]
MKAKFTEGSIFRHVSVMTFASSIGLMSLFLVDLVDMYWLSLLGVIELAAAIGYAGSILFFTLSLSIGLSIGCGALVSQSAGRGDKIATSQLVGNIFALIFAVTLPVCLLVLVLVPTLLRWLGAEGPAFEFARAYLLIILPSLPLMGVAMAAGGVMRALGHAKEAMVLTLMGGLVNAVLDPLFIFGFGWGIEGAAAATVVARIAMVVYGLYRVAFAYDLIRWPSVVSFVADARSFLATAIPAVLTNLATPIAVAYVTAIMALFGDSAVAGNAIISKLQPLAFAGLFALSGSIGPIAGQNFGANNKARVMETLRASILFTLAYSIVACGLLFMFTDTLIAIFKAKEDAAQLIKWFCYGLSSMFFFSGITFVTNALFNNLRLAHWATIFNFAKATVFTIPFVLVGADLGGPVGILVGLYCGAVLVAVAGWGMAWHKIRRLPIA